MSERRTLRNSSAGAAARRGRTGRGGPRIRRSSAAAFGRTRSLGLLAVILSGLAIYGAAASPAFGFRHLDVSGAAFTDETAIVDELGIADGTNLFRLATDGLAAELRRLPAVVDASIEVALPDTVRVRLVERVPIVVWQVGDRQLLVDANRVAFANAEATTALPVIDDRRAAGTGLSIGGVVDPVDFDAATRLGSLRPVDIGSATSALHVSIDDDHGFQVNGDAGGWTAIFGFYTPNLRTTDLIPGQVRLLRSLLAGREASIATVILSDAQNGTYTQKSGS